MVESMGSYSNPFLNHNLNLILDWNEDLLLFEETDSLVEPREVLIDLVDFFCGHVDKFLLFEERIEFSRLCLGAGIK